MGCTSSKPVPPPPTGKRGAHSPKQNRAKTPVKSAPGSVSTGEKLARMVVSKAREEEQRASAERAATTFAERYVGVSAPTSEAENFNKSDDNLSPVPAQRDSIPADKTLSAPILTDEITVSVVEPVVENTDARIISEQEATESTSTSTPISSEIENLLSTEISESEPDESSINQTTTATTETEVVQSESLVDVEKFTSSLSTVEEGAEDKDNNYLSPSDNNVDENFTSSNCSNSADVDVDKAPSIDNYASLPISESLCLSTDTSAAVGMVASESLCMSVSISVDQEGKRPKKQSLEGLSDMYVSMSRSASQDELVDTARPSGIDLEASYAPPSPLGSASPFAIMISSSDSQSKSEEDQTMDSNTSVGSKVRFQEDVNKVEFSTYEVMDVVNPCFMQSRSFSIYAKEERGDDDSVSEEPIAAPTVLGKVVIEERISCPSESVSASLHCCSPIQEETATEEASEPVPPVAAPDSLPLEPLSDDRQEQEQEAVAQSVSEPSLQEEESLPVIVEETLQQAEQPLGDVIEEEAVAEAEAENVVQEEEAAQEVTVSDEVDAESVDEVVAEDDSIVDATPATELPDEDDEADQQQPITDDEEAVAEDECREVSSDIPSIAEASVYASNEQLHDEEEEEEACGTIPVTDEEPQQDQEEEAYDEETETDSPVPVEEVEDYGRSQLDFADAAEDDGHEEQKSGCDEFCDQHSDEQADEGGYAEDNAEEELEVDAETVKQLTEYPEEVSVVNTEESECPLDAEEVSVLSFGSHASSVVTKPSSKGGRISKPAKSSPVQSAIPRFGSPQLAMPRKPSEGKKTVPSMLSPSPSKLLVPLKRPLHGLLDGSRIVDLSLTSPPISHSAKKRPQHGLLDGSRIVDLNSPSVKAVRPPIAGRVSPKAVPAVSSSNSSVGSAVITVSSSKRLSPKSTAASAISSNSSVGSASTVVASKRLSPKSSTAAATSNSVVGSGKAAVKSSGYGAKNATTKKVPNGKLPSNHVNGQKKSALLTKE